MNSDNWLDALRMMAEFRRRFGPPPTTNGRPTGQLSTSPERQKLLAGVKALEEMLDGKRDRRGMDRLAGFYGFRTGQYVFLEGKDLRRLEKVAAHLWETTGPGRGYIEEALLGNIGIAADEGSLPFYRAAIAASRPHDKLGPRRRRMAVAAIAFLAESTGSKEAHAQLVELLAHDNPTVRGDAIEHYARIHSTPQGRLTPEAKTRLLLIAKEDRAFVPRFLARGSLASANEQIPVEPADGVYTFRVSLGRTSCNIELRASQTLPELASAILGAFGWDHEHLYEFAMTGDVADRRFVLPPADVEIMPLGFGVRPKDAEPSALELPVGALGLPKGHRFVFRYDFGDDNRFDVVVAAIHPHREPRARYPRVVARTGKTPAQYPRWA